VSAIPSSTWENVMSHPDQSYLLARSEQERARASQASDEIVRAIHLKLAHEYAMRAHGSEVATREDNEVLGLTAGRLRLL
jgi:hypothetical protein